MTDFQRLILALPPPGSSDRVLDRESPRTPPSTGAVNTAPAGQTPDTYSSFFRSDESLATYLVPGQNPTAMAESVRSWFRGDSEAAVEARGNYIARDTALSVTFVAFHESRNLEERRRLLTYFVEGVRGLVETLRQLRRETSAESLSESADAILRLSILVGLFLRDVEASEIPQEEKRRCQDQLRDALRQAYGVVDGAVGSNHPEWRHLQEFVRALNLAQEPPFHHESMGAYVDWIREIHDHLNQAEGALGDRSEYREEISSLIQSTRSSLPPSPSSTALGRTFISYTTAAFVTLVASEIDQEDGDSAQRVQGRYETLMSALETDLAAHPDSTFEAALNRLNTEEAVHLKSLLENSALLRELVAADRDALANTGSLSTGRIVSRWGEEVLSRLERHSLNWGENFLAQGEQHLGATRAILQFFRTQEGNNPSLRSAFADFAGRDPSNSLSDRLSSRADMEWRSLDSTGFGVASGASHFFSVHTVPFVAGGALLSRLSAWSLFAGAGESGRLVWGGIPAIRSVPVLRSVPFLGRAALIEGGEMTGAGRFAAATLTGTGLSLGFSGTQFAQDLAAGRPEALENFGRNLGLGILVNSAALGLSALLSAGLRRSLATPRGVGASAVTSPGRFSAVLERLITPRRALLYYGSHAAIGTAGMISTNAFIRGIHNVGLPEGERVPYTGADEVTETYLNLIAMNLAELPLQRVAMRRQLGRFRTSQLENLSREIMNPHGSPEGPLTRDASLAQERVFQFLALRNLRGVPLETLRSESFRDYAMRTLLPPRPAAVAEELVPLQADAEGEPPVETQGTSGSGPYRSPGSPGAPSTGSAEPAAESSSEGRATIQPTERPPAQSPPPAASPVSATPRAERSIPPGDATATVRTPAVPEEGSRPSRPSDLSRTIPGTSSDTSTQIIQPQRNFLIRLRDRILATRAAAERRYAVVTLRETGEEFDPEASLRTVRYQEALPEPRPRQIILERRAAAADHPRVVLVGQNLEGVSTETQAFMRLFLEQIFPRVEAPGFSGVAPQAAPSAPSPQRAPARPRSAPPPAATVRPARPGEPPVVRHGESIENVFAGLAAEVEAASGTEGSSPLPEAAPSAAESSGAHPRIPTPPPPPPRESSPEVGELSDPFATPPPRQTPGRVPTPPRPERPAATPREEVEGTPEPTQRIHVIEMKTQAAIELSLRDYFDHPIPGLLRLVQDAQGRRRFEWYPGGLTNPPPPPLGGRILATVRITGDLTRDPGAYSVVPSLNQDQWAQVIESAMHGIVQNRTHVRGRSP